MLLKRTLFWSFFVSLILFSGCATTPKQTGPPAVAVWDLEELNYDKSSRPDLGQILTSGVMEAIRDKGSYQVVERQQLLLVLEELNLGSSDLADENTRLRIGKIAGANQMIFGAYQVLGDVMRIDLRLVDVSTGKIVRAAQETTMEGGISAWLDAARDAADELFQ